MGPPHEGSIRWPIAPWANALTTELHLAPRCRKKFRKCVWGGAFLQLTRWSSASHTVLLGFNPASRQAKLVSGTAWCCRNSRLTRATRGLALSCWNIPPLTFLCRMTWCCRWHCTKSSDCQVRVRGAPWNCYGVNVTNAYICDSGDLCRYFDIYPMYSVAFVVWRIITQWHLPLVDIWGGCKYFNWHFVWIWRLPL